MKNVAHFSLSAVLVIVLGFLMLANGTLAIAQSETVLCSFKGGGDGKWPNSSLVFDKAGNLYGTTSAGGDGNSGTVFRLSPRQGGGWDQSVLYWFKGGTSDGSYPVGALIFDPAGHLYGVTMFGGTNDQGTVYELTPTHAGLWREKVLFNFVGYEYTGWEPMSGLVLDAQGNLYGVTEFGGMPGYGVAYELSRSASGTWSQTILHDFTNGSDGWGPVGTLIFDALGNLYGTSADTAFELSPIGGGVWTLTVLSPITVPNGFGVSGLTLDAMGNLYGASWESGTGYGQVFELTPPVGGGTWVQTALYTFTGGQDGGLPIVTALALDSQNNVYGTTNIGGTYGRGTVFKLAPSTGGGWTESVLHSFHGADGGYPDGGVILDGVGNLYGTTLKGGQSNMGTVFEITP
jgi:uncharacterized repeat protein (TIGR03803 family)